MNDPRVSVIIPTYNCAKYIAQSIDSVLAQTRPVTEILIIDDGSTDDTAAAVRAYSDPRIRYLGLPHRGTAAARSTGIDRACGDYLAFLDADDLWRPRMLERHLQVMEHDSTVVCSFTNFIRFMDETGERLPEQFEYYPELATLAARECGCADALIVEGDAFAQLIRFQEIPAFMQCILFRRAAIADMRLNESLRRCQDLEFVARAFMRGNVAFSREVLTEVRRHDSNITKDISLMALDKLWALLPLQAAVDTPARHAALNDRLVKAWIDAATALIRAGRRWEGLRHHAKAFTVPGSARRKLRGTARVGYELAASFGGATRALRRDATGSSAPADAPWPSPRRRLSG